MIDLQINLRGVEEILAKNARFLPVLRRAVVNSLRRTTRRAATEVKADVRTRSGIGRKIWGKDPSGLTKQGLISIIQPQVRGDSIEAGLKLRGIPRLLEEGGRYGPHTIRSKRGGFLVFEGRPRGEFGTSSMVVTRKVEHRGSPVRPHGFGGSALRRRQSEIADDLNLSIRNAVNATYGQ